jgi:hypothetical protein
MAIWYRDGTVTVVNGSAIVQGVGTAFLQNAAVGSLFVGPDARFYEISQVISESQLRLVKAYIGTGIAGTSYAIAPSLTSGLQRLSDNTTSQSNGIIPALTQAVNTMVSDVGGIKQSWDASTMPNMAQQAPAALATTAQIGSSKNAAREDHVHPLPTALQLGLGNVNNTSDTGKPVSTAQAAAIAGRLPVDLSNVTAAAGATDSDIVPVNQGTVLRKLTLAQIFTRLMARANTWVGVQTFSLPFKPAPYAKGGLPNVATYNGHLILVTDATGGPKLCLSNGTVWQILNTTTAVV